MLVNKKEFSDRLASNMKSSKKEAEAWVDAVLETFTDCFVAGDDVRFTGFGTFSLKTVPAHQATIPSNGETIMVPEKVKLNFKVGKALKEAL